MKTIAVIAAIALLAAPAGYAFGAEPGQATKTDKGRVLTDQKGMTLYIFDKDKGGKPSCNGACLAVWPPLMATNVDHAHAGWKRVSRDNGSEQWAYKGRPVYTYALDSKPGDIKGDGVEGTWHLARP